MSEVILNLDEHHIRVLKEAAARERLSEDDLVARLLDVFEAGVAETPSSNVGAEVNRPTLALRDWLKEYAGCVKDAPPDLSTNPNYLDDFGRD